MLLDTKKILSQDRVAEIFKKSERWVALQVSRGLLPVHYAGDTPMFYEDEVVGAFLDGKLELRRRRHDPEGRKEIRQSMGSPSQGWGPHIISDVRTA